MGDAENICKFVHLFTDVDLLNEKLIIFELTLKQYGLLHHCLPVAKNFTFVDSVTIAIKVAIHALEWVIATNNELTHWTFFKIFVVPVAIVSNLQHKSFERGGGVLCVDCDIFATVWR